MRVGIILLVDVKLAIQCPNETGLKIPPVIWYKADPYRAESTSQKFVFRDHVGDGVRFGCS